MGAPGIADVQGGADTRRIAIDRVGIRSLRHPMQISDRSGDVQPTVATCNLYVHLSHERRGAHMSRFVSLLNEWQGTLSVASLPALLADMTRTLEADAGRIELRFAYFVRKQAPVSGVASMLDYEVTLAGDINTRGTELEIQVVVPVTSLCPCSKEISEYGAHNQRAHITVSARTRGAVWIEDIIDLVESEASCEIFGLLKRPDEKYVTERAYENPKFVEDVVRDLAARLAQDERITAFKIESENFESIHNHSAYAMIEHTRT